MRSPKFGGLPRILSIVAAFALALGATAAGAQVYTGKATRVGDVPPVGTDDDAIVSIGARFASASAIDLSTAKLTISSLLKEGAAGGAGELVQGTGGAALVPLTLSPRIGSRDSSAIFVTAGTLRPSVRAAVRRRADGTYQLNLKVSRATIPTSPALCSGDPSTTSLTTTISFGDGVNPPVLTKTFDTAWLCSSGRLRVAPPGPAPTPVPGIPVAKLRVEQITRESGEPNLVELDGSSSSDSDGTIASYTFSVVNLDTDVVVFGPSTVATATVETTLPPGDYRASLTVKDNDNKVSATASRGFTLH